MEAMSEIDLGKNLEIVEEHLVIPGNINSALKGKKNSRGFLAQPFKPWVSYTPDFSYNEIKIIKRDKRKDDYYEAKCSLIWIPLIKRVVREGADNEIINPLHIHLFENIMFGLIAFESCGRFAQTGDFGNSQYQALLGSFRGLTQMVAEKHYLEENPYDPLTSLRIGLRNTAPFIYNQGNVEAALAEHNNGKTDIYGSRASVDAFCTFGQEFVMRVVNVAWWGHVLVRTNNRFTDKEYYNQQFDMSHRNALFYRYGPHWDFIKLNEEGILEIVEPDLPFNWEPPHTSLAWQYIQKMPGESFREKCSHLIGKRLERGAWSDTVHFGFQYDSFYEDKLRKQSISGINVTLEGMEIPDWFYNGGLAPDMPAASLRPANSSDLSAYPKGSFGKTPAMVDIKHQFYLEDNDILKDCIGRERSGKWFIYTSHVMQQKKYCLYPFINFEVYSNNDARCCCEGWMPARIGDFSQSTVRELWNSEILQKIRQSILDGTYEYCNRHQCVYYNNHEYYLYTRDDLEGLAIKHLKKYQPWIKYILEGKTYLDILPANYNLAYDETCNLKCPSCRSDSIIFTQGPEYEKRQTIHNKLLKEIEESGLENIGNLNITGAGEPFFSKIFSSFLFNFDGRRYPNLKISIQSNGVMFSPQIWDRINKIHDNIDWVIISIDAACEETYDKIRVNGRFDILLHNLEYLASLRGNGKIKRLSLAFVVQQKNYKEMIPVIRLAKKLGVDFITFNLITDWGCLEKEELNKNFIWKTDHPEYGQFIEILRDPIFDDPVVDLGNITEYRNLAVNAAEAFSNQPV
jgi:wyosine [tRNA(Phe)-imidazoG37] synthetase (radical SAM superfamily)